MTRPAITYADAEDLVVAALTELLADRNETATVSIGVPGDIEAAETAQGWPDDHPPHLQVADDGARSSRGDISLTTLIRLTGWATTTDEAKRLTDLAEALLCSSASAPWIVRGRRAVRFAPTQDPTSRVELASTTVNVTVRGELLA